MSDPHLARNLRALCSYTNSISDACRSMGINRQQFTKYLSALGPAAPQIDRMFNQSSESLKPYCGYYFYYYHTPSRPGMIRRSAGRRAHG